MTGRGDFDISEPTRGEKGHDRLTYADVCREAATMLGRAHVDLDDPFYNGAAVIFLQHRAVHLRTLADLLDDEKPCNLTMDEWLSALTSPLPDPSR